VGAGATALPARLLPISQITFAPALTEMYDAARS